MAKKKKDPTVHNTHLLLPEELWQKLSKRAKRDDNSVTELIVKAAQEFLNKK